MELGFNLLFLAIATVACFCWLRSRSSDSRKVGIYTGALVLGCILVLLFPLISITDDLHATSDVAEEMSLGARKAHLVLLAHVVAAVTVSVLVPEPAIVYPAASVEQSVFLPHVVRSVAGCRAPPLA